MTEHGAARANLSPTSGLRRLSRRPRLRTTINGRTLVWARSPEMSAEDHAAFTECWASFIEVYNATPAYRTGTGSDSVLEQHQRQRELRGVER